MLFIVRDDGMLYKDRWIFSILPGMKFWEESLGIGSDLGANHKCT